MREAAPSVGQMVSEVASIAAQIDPDDMTYPQLPSVEAFRLGVIALTRLKAYESLSMALLDANNLLKVRWWPVAWAFQQLADPRAAGALTELIRGSGSYRISFAARGLGRLGDPIKPRENAAI